MGIALSKSKLGGTGVVAGILKERTGLLPDAGIADDADCMRSEAEAEGSLY